MSSADIWFSEPFYFNGVALTLEVRKLLDYENQYSIYLLPNPKLAHKQTKVLEPYIGKKLNVECVVGVEGFRFQGWVNVAKDGCSARGRGFSKIKVKQSGVPSDSKDLFQLKLSLQADK